ncbi:hypothetical protein V6N13_133983 [Hibiscus sabdariffa]|uniref:Uncharacterized protein n=1 Tax=Hibiscus sabdariffa TaxID=183260 RepID=A0ABR2R005_9ROSI
MFLCHSVAWNCTGTGTGSKLASGSVDQNARVWHIEPHRHGKAKDIESKGHTDSVDQLCWDPKHADLIATASGDKTVVLSDARSGKCSQQAELSGENINITYKPDGTHIAVGTVEVLAYPLLRPVDTLMAHSAGCYLISKLCCILTSLVAHPRGSCLDILPLPVFVKIIVFMFVLLSETVQCSYRANRASNSLSTCHGMEWNPKYNLLAYAGDGQESGYLASKAVS